MKPVNLTDSNFLRIKKWCDATGHGTNTIIEMAFNALESIVEASEKEAKERIDNADGRVDLRGDDV